jgi:CheY-like chemotaxis protein
VTEKILVVDDEVDSTTLMSLILRKLGFNVVTASSGREALAKAVETVPDLILLDVMMPEMDGYEVCRQVRADPLLNPIPIVFLTAKNEVDDRIMGFQAGGDDYLIKPIHQGELAVRVNALLTRTAAMRAAIARVAYVVGILGLKGGLGTTTLAVNLALACLRAPGGGVRTLLAEMVSGQASAGLMLGMRSTQGLGVLLRTPPAEITARAVETWLVPHGSGLRLLLGPMLHNDASRNWTPELAEPIVRHLRRTADLIVMDLGTGLTPANRTIISMIDRLIVTLDPHPLSLAMAQTALESLSAVGGGANYLDVVMINRAPSTQMLSVPMLEEALHREISQVISPATEIMYQTVQHGVPLMLSDPHHMVSGQFQELAKKILDHMTQTTGAASSADGQEHSGATGPLQPVTGPLRAGTGQFVVRL